MVSPLHLGERGHMADEPPLAPLPPIVLDERSRPDFRDHYLGLLEEARAVSVAASRIRLAGLQVDAARLQRPDSIRVLVMELSGITLAMEAERISEARPGGRERIAALGTLLSEGRLQVRSSPLAGWAPDFSVFQSREGASFTLALGTHWMDRPYPHPGPALNVLLEGPPARSALHRFDELWRQAHDVGEAILRTLTLALARTSGVEPDTPGTTREDAHTGDSLRG